MTERLNRFLARAGVASRRASDRLIQTGSVKINGAVVTHPGTRLNPRSDRVCVNGQAIQSVDRQTYILLHKPPGYLVSARDPHHAQTIYKLLRGIDARVFPVGRLDLDTRGVLLLMDDGDLSFRLTHPRYRVKKVYRAWVRGHPGEAVLTGMREGVKLSDGVTASAHIRVMRARGGDTELELVLHEGRKRQVKRMCEAAGHRVRSLTRTHFAGITTRHLELGQWRYLTQAEVKRLRELVGLNHEQ
ncbi:MAG: rRNA pseudouridine synthase [Candidatus Latescibacteria bacterium]|nr:rRNA pseudouridine synthase [Candidatus Latescibacterota bacterium]